MPRMIIATKVTLIGLADVKMLSKKKLTRPSTRFSLRAMPTSETFDETHFSLAFSVGVLKGSDDSMHGARERGLPQPISESTLSKEAYKVNLIFDLMKPTCLISNLSFRVHELSKTFDFSIFGSL